MSGKTTEERILAAKASNTTWLLATVIALAVAVAAALFWGPKDVQRAQAERAANGASESDNQPATALVETAAADAGTETVAAMDGKVQDEPEAPSVPGPDTTDSVSAAPAIDDEAAVAKMLFANMPPDVVSNSDAFLMTYARDGAVLLTGKLHDMHESATALKLVTEAYGNPSRIINHVGFSSEISASPWIERIGEAYARVGDNRAGLFVFSGAGHRQVALSDLAGAAVTNASATPAAGAPLATAKSNTANSDATQAEKHATANTSDEMEARSRADVGIDASLSVKPQASAQTAAVADVESKADSATAASALPAPVARAQTGAADSSAATTSVDESQAVSTDSVPAAPSGSAAVAATQTQPANAPVARGYGYPGNAHAARYGYYPQQAARYQLSPQAGVAGVGAVAAGVGTETGFGSGFVGNTQQQAGVDELDAINRSLRYRIRFANNRPDMTHPARAELSALVSYLQRYPTVSVQIGVHTDSRGTSASNDSLTQTRADQIKATLVELGADDQRVVAKGFGARKPIASNQSPVGRSLNRRVEITLAN